MYSQPKNKLFLLSQQRNVEICMRCLSKRYKSFVASKKKCLYEVLGVSQNASKKDIRSAYVFKTKELHPDKDINDPDLHDRFVEVNEAYSILGDPSKRAEYDDSRSNVSRVRYTSAQTSTSNPFGNMRNGSEAGNSYYDPKYEGFYSSDQYARNSYRDFEFIREKYKGERRSANKYIIGFILAFMSIGAGVHYIQINYLRQRFKDHEDKAHHESTLAYDSVREKARLNGPRKQLKLLASSQVSPDTTETKL